MKNNLFNPSVDVKKWAKAAAVRAVKTIAQSILASVTVGAVITEIDWVYVLGVAATAGVYSIVTSLAGIPEVEAE